MELAAPSWRVSRGLRLGRARRGRGERPIVGPWLAAVERGSLQPGDLAPTGSASGGGPSSGLRLLRDRASARSRGLRVAIAPAVVLGADRSVSRFAGRRGPISASRAGVATRRSPLTESWVVVHDPDWDRDDRRSALHGVSERPGRSSGRASGARPRSRGAGGVSWSALVPKTGAPCQRLRSWRTGVSLGLPSTPLHFPLHIPTAHPRCTSPLHIPAVPPPPALAAGDARRPRGLSSLVQPRRGAPGEASP